MNKIYMRVDGIHCDHCIDTITKSLYKIKNIKNIKINKNIVEITYTGNVNNKSLINNINSIGYYTCNDYISYNKRDINNNINLYEFIIILSIILLISYLFYKLFGFNILNIIPNIDNNITYGMIFVTGLLTSIHCISMCGAINLYSSIDNKVSFKRPLLYNIGRVISYSIIGFIIGLIGSLFTINDTFNGIIVLLAGIIMLLMGLKMLGVINFKYKHIKYKYHSSNPFVIGLLNGLMPCGPMDAMKVYALSLGSPIRSCFALFLFGLGTVPLMMFVGVFINIFKGKYKVIINKIASVLIFILSLVMINRGLLYLNIDISSKFINNYEGYSVSKLDGDIQVIEFDLDYSNYQDILLLNGIKTKMIIHVDKNKLTGCNEEIVIKEFNIRRKLKVGDNVIWFTPKKDGNYSITCWMNMIHNNMVVTSNKTYFNKHTSGDKIPVNLKSAPKGSIHSANIVQDKVIINKDDISHNVSYIDYVYEEVHIGIIAVRNSKGDVIVLLNTCASCNPSPRAYFIQVGDSLECQNCGSRFKIDELDSLDSSGCHPIKIDTYNNGNVIEIDTNYLNSFKDKFKNWLGPKID